MPFENTSFSLRQAVLFLATLILLWFAGWSIYRFTNGDFRGRNHHSGDTSKEPNEEAPPLQDETFDIFKKNASFYSETNKFEKNETILRRKVAAFNAVVQHEQRIDTPGHRRLHLLLGVQPELFDSFLVVARGVGFVCMEETRTKDKAYVLHDLSDKKGKLEQNLSKLNDLKTSTSGDNALKDFQNDVSDLEREIQEIQVELQGFSPANELYTVRFSLSESLTVRIVPIH